MTKDIGQFVFASKGFGVTRIPIGERALMETCKACSMGRGACPVANIPAITRESASGVTGRVFTKVISAVVAVERGVGTSIMGYDAGRPEEMKR